MEYIRAGLCLLVEFDSVAGLGGVVFGLLGVAGCCGGGVGLCACCPECGWMLGGLRECLIHRTLALSSRGRLCCCVLHCIGPIDAGCSRGLCSSRDFLSTAMNVCSCTHGAMWCGENFPVGWAPRLCLVCGSIPCAKCFRTRRVTTPAGLIQYCAICCSCAGVPYATTTSSSSSEPAASAECAEPGDRS